MEHLLCETGHGFVSARFQSTCTVFQSTLHHPRQGWSCEQCSQRAKNQIHALFLRHICFHHDTCLLHFGTRPAEIAPPTSGILPPGIRKSRNQIPVAQVETERQRGVSVHVWHIWLPLGSLSDNRFLSVFRWIKLTRDQAQPNIAFAVRGGHMRRLWSRLTLILGNALVIWGRGM